MTSQLIDHYAENSGEQLIKRVNALAEEAGKIAQSHGLELVPPFLLMREAQKRAIPDSDYRRLLELFIEIAALKEVLAARKSQS